MAFLQGQVSSACIRSYIIDMSDSRPVCALHYYSQDCFVNISHEDKNMTVF